MEELSKQLGEILSKLSQAIEAGVDKLPTALEFLLSEIVRFYIARGIASSVWVFVGFMGMYIIYKAYKKQVKYVRENGLGSIWNENNDGFPFLVMCVFGGTFSLIIFLASLYNAIDWFIKAAAPIGSIMHKQSFI